MILPGFFVSMKVVKVKTARFTELVRVAGQPEPYLPWQDPARDPDFQKKLREHRVLTVHQETVGSRTDFGVVGYNGDRKGSLFIFPKSIEAYAGRRIVGIQYHKVAQPEPDEPYIPPPPRKKKARQAVVAEPPPPPAPIPKVKAKSQPKPVPKPKPAPPSPLEEAPGLASTIRELRRAIADARAALEKDQPIAALRALERV